jgi:hypothetical protein
VNGLATRLVELLKSEVPAAVHACRMGLGRLAIIAAPLVAVALAVRFSISTSQPFSGWWLTGVMTVLLLAAGYSGLRFLAPALELLPEAASQSRWSRSWGLALGVGVAVAVAGAYVYDLFRALAPH